MPFHPRLCLVGPTTEQWVSLYRTHTTLWTNVLCKLKVVFEIRNVFLFHPKQLLSQYFRDVTYV